MDVKKKRPLAETTTPFSIQNFRFLQKIQNSGKIGLCYEHGEYFE